MNIIRWWRKKTRKHVGVHITIKDMNGYIFLDSDSETLYFLYKYGGQSLVDGYLLPATPLRIIITPEVFK